MTRLIGSGVMPQTTHRTPGVWHGSPPSAHQPWHPIPQDGTA